MNHLVYECVSLGLSLYILDTRLLFLHILQLNKNMSALIDACCRFLSIYTP